jgi:hypothetical protein
MPDNEVVQFPKRIDGLSASERRAIALYEWLENNGPTSSAKIMEEMARLREMIPDES